MRRCLFDVRLLRTVGDTLALIGIELSTSGDRESGLRMAESVHLALHDRRDESGVPPDSDSPAVAPNASERLLPV